MCLTVKIGDVEFANPILTASGTFGYGTEVSELIDVNQFGGIISKSITLNPREGNQTPRIVETASGMLNSIGLANIGVDEFCRKKLPYLDQLQTQVIVNIAGSTISEYLKVLELIEDFGGDHAGYEINISCPNVKEGGMEFGVNAVITEKLTAQLRKVTKRLLIMKLSPNVTHIEDIAQAAEQGGADAVSAINTVVGMAIDIQTRKPKLNTIYGGLSGPAIKPVALARIHKIAKVIEIPIIGIGGISSGKDVIEFVLAGADLIQIGTLNFKQPAAISGLKDELSDYCHLNKIGNIRDLKGKLKFHE